MNMPHKDVYHDFYFSVKFGIRKLYNEPDIIQIDHAYNKMMQLKSYNHLSTILLFYEDEKKPDVEIDIIDVDTVDDKDELNFNLPKQAFTLMNECEDNVNFARESEDPLDIDDKIAKPSCNIQQSQLYTRVIKALQNDRLCKLANTGKLNEPILRRISVEKTAMRLSKAFSIIRWDKDLLQWLNNILISSLTHSALAGYLDAIQTLREKIPKAIDKMLEEMLSNSNETSAEALRLLLQRPWDPMHKLFHLNELPILAVKPNIIMLTTFSHNLSNNKRFKYWSHEFSSFSNFFQISSDFADLEMHFSTKQFKDTVDCIKRLINEHTNQPLIVITWGYTAKLAVQVILNLKVVNYVIFISLDLMTSLSLELNACPEIQETNKIDIYKEIQTWNLPTMFIMGENSNKNILQRSLSFKEEMCAISRLLMVGGANDNLIISYSKRGKHFSTQKLVDRCTIEMIHEFISICIEKPPSPTNEIIATSIAL